MFLILAGVGLSFLLSASPAAADLITDPTGDTFGVGSPQLDIVSFSGERTSTAFVFKVNFLGPISPASAFAPNSVVGFIDLDTDQNPATGATPFINIFGPPPPINLGDEFFIDIGSESFHPGLVDVVNALTNIPTGQAPISFTSNGFTISVPFGLLPGANTSINFGVIVGTFNEPTDRAPNGSTPATTTVPEPTSLCVFGLIFAGAGFMAFRRKKRTT
jgi:hypothetical protein